MTGLNKRLKWSVPVAAIAVAPFTLIPQQATCAVLDAIEWVGNDRVASLLAVTNALTLLH